MADTADTDRFGPISAESARFWPRRPASARVGIRHVARRGTTRDGRAVYGVPPASPHPAASDAGALAWEPRPCILVAN
uniref:Uncharacterized protein n=1 Tax=Quercus lobata TaxID=97700 RepID=A0A7N2LKJ6_QUELO